MTDNFEFTDKLKKNLFIMMGVGLIGLVFTFLLYPENHHARLWSNLLANTYYFTGIGLFGLFVVAATQLAYGGWQTLMKRIFLSLSAWVRVSGVLLFLIVLAGYFGVHTLYDHAKEIIHTNPVPETLTTKVVWFAPAFWFSRLIAYAALWFGASWYMNKFFARTDQTDPKVYKQSKLVAAAFIVIFAVTESSASWDYIMSLDPRWYSTLFGWYNFASYGCAAWGMTILLVIYLKSKGYLPKVNENHVHDLGKMLFGFSIFWTYLWFSQFMLQWYANMPEETSFWINRFDVGYFKFTIFLALIINFLFPLLFLIKRGNKRSFKIVGFGAALLIFGHYIDFFNYTFVEANWNAAAAEHHHEAKLSEKVVFYAQAENLEKKPVESTDAVVAVENKEEVTTEVNAEHHGEAKTHEEHKEGEHEAPVKNFAGIGIGEILIFIGFLGAFLFAFFRNLAERPITPENDPYLKESEKLTVTYS
ncbi:MAG: hypothetical protein U0T74_09740 [Chitinophagales bacterium]